MPTTNPRQDAIEHLTYLFKTELFQIIISGIIFFFLLGLGVSLLSKYFFSNKQLISSNQICLKSNYEQVSQCGDYFIASRPCCDQPSDILNKNGIELATCGGLVPPIKPPQCLKYEQLLKNINQTECQITTCTSQKISPYQIVSPTTPALINTSCITNEDCQKLCYMCISGTCQFNPATCNPASD